MSVPSCPTQPPATMESLAGVVGSELARINHLVPGTLQPRNPNIAAKNSGESSGVIGVRQIVAYDHDIRWGSLPPCINTDEPCVDGLAMGDAIVAYRTRIGPFICSSLILTDLRSIGIGDLEAQGINVDKTVITTDGRLWTPTHASVIRSTTVTATAHADRTVVGVTQHQLSHGRRGGQNTGLQLTTRILTGYRHHETPDKELPDALFPMRSMRIILEDPARAVVNAKTLFAAVRKQFDSILNN